MALRRRNRRAVLNSRQASEVMTKQQKIRQTLSNGQHLSVIGTPCTFSFAPLHCSLSATKRVPKRDCTTLWVHFFHGNLEVFHAHRGLRRKRFVNFEDVHVLQGQVGLLERGWNREGRPDAHEVGIHAHDCVAAHAREDGKRQLLRNIATCKEHQGCAIRDLTRVPRMRGSILLEHGLQLRQTLDRRASPRPLVCRYHNLLFSALLILHCCRHTHDLFVKEPRLLGCKRLVVRVHCHLILLGTGDLPLLRHVLRSDTHGCQARGSHLVGGELLGELVHVHPRGHVVHRHGLNPPC